MKKPTLILLVVGLVILGVMLFRNPTTPREEVPPTATPAMEEVSEEVMTEEELIAPTIQELVLGNSATTVAKLDDVSGGNATGTGYILRKDGKLYHFVRGVLPDPEGENKYEGWLVKQKPELMFFSTGVMAKQADGSHTLSYMQNELSEGYDFVVITEEIVVDATPETHIIEGLAQ